MITVIEKQKIIELRASGFSYDKISKELNISKPTLIKLSKELSLEIYNLKELNKDLIFEKYKINKTHQLEMLATIHKKVLSEIERRDFTDIKTNILLDMLHKNIKLIHEFENIDIELREESIGPDFDFTTTKTWKA